MNYQSVFAAEVLYAPTIGVVKISTLLLFARIFPGQKFKRMLWAVGLFTSTYSAVMVVTMIFQCRPFRRVWDPTVKADCVDISKVWIVMASLNVLTDFLLLCLPLPQLWKLQMHRGTKVQLIGIFSIGSLSETHSHSFHSIQFHSCLTKGAIQLEARALTANKAPLSSPSTASPSCVACLYIRWTPPGQTSSPRFGPSLKSQLLCWARPLSLIVLCSIRSSGFNPPRRGRSVNCKGSSPPSRPLAALGVRRVRALVLMSTCSRSTSCTHLFRHRFTAREFQGKEMGPFGSSRSPCLHI